MKEKTTENKDFSDLLLDDEFVSKVNDPSCSDDYIIALKEKRPEQARDIDLALQVLERMKNKTVFSTDEQRLKIWDSLVDVFNDSMSESSVKQLNDITRRARFWKTISRVAASIILVVGLGATAIYFSKKDDLAIDRFAASGETNYKESQLILTNGKKIIVPAGEANIRYSPDGSNVTINDTSDIIQSIKKEEFNQIVVPYGKYVHLKLSDGTKVWLNSGSRMVYPPVFAEGFREVYLQGEGYFEVTKNAQRPFYVKTDRMKVEVLGTKFDVQAYAKENTYSTLLLEGKVSLSTREKISFENNKVILNPSEKGDFSESSDKFDIEKVDHPANYIAWTYGYLNFEEEALGSILKRVSRHYGVDIKLLNNSGSFKISGKLDLKDDPERVLKSIAVIAKLRINKEKGGFVITN